MKSKEEKEKMIEAMQELLDKLDSKTTKRLSESIQDTIENNPILSKKYEEFMNRDMCTIRYTRAHTEIIWKSCLEPEKKMAAVDIISHLLTNLKSKDKILVLRMIITNLDMNNEEDDED